MATTLRPRTRVRRMGLAGGDKAWLVAMVGIPTFLHVVLVWIPALITGVLSFTRWDNLAPLSAIQFVGARNYWEIVTIFESSRTVPPFAMSA